MEVCPEQVTLLEEVGRGAFGKVHKAVLRESPGVEVFDGNSRGTRVQFKEGRTIAVKVLSGKNKAFLFTTECICDESTLSLGLIYELQFFDLTILCFDQYFVFTYLKKIDRLRPRAHVSSEFGSKSGYF